MNLVPTQKRDQLIQGVLTGALLAIAASLVVAGALLYL